MLIAGLLLEGLPSALGSPAAAQDSSTDQPVLWSGTLTTKTGKPTAGHVTVSARPPASSVPSASASSKPAAPTPVVLGQADAASDGRFEVRAAPDLTSVPKGWVSEDGLLNIVAVATASNGEWTMAVDTVRVLDEPGVGRGWFTNGSRYDQAKAEAHTATTQGRVAGDSLAAGQRSLTAAAKADETAATSEGERSATLQMTFAAPAKQAAPSGDGSFSAASIDPMHGYNCYTDATLGTALSNRSFFETQTVQYYEMWTNYMSSKSTSFNVGVSANGSSGWSLAGTSTIGDQSGVSLIDHMYSDGNSVYKARVHVGVVHTKYRWQCYFPGSSMHVGTVYTVEPTQLNGGHSYDLGSPSVGCNPTYKAEIGPNGTTHRKQDSSESNGYMASIWGFSAGQTTTFRTSVDVSWTNHSVYTRYICGESNYITNKTRASAVS